MRKEGFRSQDKLVWQVGFFDQDSYELGPGDKYELRGERLKFMPAHATHVMHANWRDPVRWENVPPFHMPKDKNNSTSIDILFYAEMGPCTLTVGQLPSEKPETVSVYLSGKDVGSFTTSKEYTLHKFDCMLDAYGALHTLTLGEYGQGDGYEIDAIKLERQRAPDFANAVKKW